MYHAQLKHQLSLFQESFHFQVNLGTDQELTPSVDQQLTGITQGYSTHFRMMFCAWVYEGTQAALAHVSPESRSLTLLTTENKLRGRD